MEQHMHNAKGVIAKVLTPEQTRRLQEITFQINGPCFVLMNPQLAESLRLSPEQKSRVETLCGQMAEQMHRTQKLNGKSSAERCAAQMAMRRRMQQLRQETNQRITDLFSEDQTASYAKLVGEPFAFDSKEGPPCPEDGKMVGGHEGWQSP